MAHATDNAHTSQLREEAGRFKAAFDASLRDYLTTTQARYHTRLPHPNLDQMFSHLTEICEGGKRLRPFIAFSLYRATNPTATLSDVREILLAIELFHIFCLIHDDVMDEAPLRHGTPTLHHFVRDHVYAGATRQVSTIRASESQAILIGDLVFNLVTQLLDAADTQRKPHLPAVRRLFHDLVEEVCLGQMLDIDLTVRLNVPEAEVLRKNEFKTARYSFMRPLQIGATLAGRPEILPVCEAFGLALGQLYQTQDDLLDIFGDSAETKKETMTDITQNQHTVLTAHVRTVGGTATATLDSFIGTTISPDGAQTLRTLFIDTGAVAHAEQLCATFITAAQVSVTDERLTKEESAFLNDFIDLVHQRRTWTLPRLRKLDGLKSTTVLVTTSLHCFFVGGSGRPFLSSMLLFVFPMKWSTTRNRVVMQLPFLLTGNKTGYTAMRQVWGKTTFCRLPANYFSTIRSHSRLVLNSLMP